MHNITRVFFAQVNQALSLRTVLSATGRCFRSHGKYTHFRSVAPVFLIIIAFLSGCTAKSRDHVSESKPSENELPSEPGLTLGIERGSVYLPMLQGKKVGIVVNHTSCFPDGKHLADFLKEKGIDVRTIFAPEHGFRGKADAGEHVKNGRDLKTGVPIISLYGKNKKPSKAQIDSLDIVVFDIQDVGARFYTYISTMHYVMEACAENAKKVIVLDRPNPNGHYTAGPVREKGFKSFVGMHPIPVVHGLTVGELARMINGEKWLTDGLEADLTLIPCTGYTHQTPYELPIKPSPNLPNTVSVALYPSLCFFEGTVMSVGRGTDFPFQAVGHPKHPETGFSFTPAPNEGASSPKYKDELCKGIDFRNQKLESNFSWKPLLNAYRSMTEKRGIKPDDFFIGYFDTLAGTDKLRKMILEGKTETEINKAFHKDLENYREKRKKYLLYP